MAASQKKPQQSKGPRKYSDNKYDNPAYDAKIEQQTLQMIRAITGEDLQTKPESPKPAAAKKKNLLGLDFEIPDELSQLIALEMKSKKGAEK